MNLRTLMRPDLVALAPYPTPPTLGDLRRRLGPGVVKADANENPYGPSPRVADALACCDVARYPDALSSELCSALARHVGTDAGRIICSVGGDEMLDLLLRLFVEPDDEVIDLTPSFVMYELSTVYNRGRVVRVPRDEDFAVDVAAIERAITPRTKVIFLCNPNNPTGNATSLEDIERVLSLGTIVVLDEAYAEFAGWSHVGLVERFPNLVILRTMSKWAALAGIRLGYAVADPLIVHEMRKIKSPYNVSAAAQVAGVASIEDRVWLMGNVRKIVEERDRLLARLQSLPCGTVYPSHTNFLFMTTGKVPARDWKEVLDAEGILLRAIVAPVNALRISVGTPEESDLIVAALERTYLRFAS